MFPILGTFVLSVIEDGLAPLFINVSELGFVDRFEEYQYLEYNSENVSMGSRTRFFSYSGVAMRNCCFFDLITLGQDILTCSGGAICIYNSDLFLESCRFKNCSAKIGGSLSCIQVNSVIQNSHFYCCASLQIGGAIFCSSDTMQKSSYINNIDFSIVGTNFTNCSSQYTSGAISVHFIEDFLLFKSLFEFCSSCSSGGCVGIYTSIANILECTFNKSMLHVLRDNVTHTKDPYQKQLPFYSGSSIYIKNTEFPNFDGNNLANDNIKLTNNIFTPSVLIQKCAFYSDTINPNLNPNATSVCVEGNILVECNEIEASFRKEDFIKAITNNSIIRIQGGNFGQLDIIESLPVNTQDKITTAKETLVFESEKTMSDPNYPKVTPSDISPTKSPYATSIARTLEFGDLKTIPVPTQKTPDPRATVTPTASLSVSPTLTATVSPSLSPTISPSASASASPSRSISPTFTASISVSPTLTATVSPSLSPTISPSASASASPSRSISPTRSVSPKPTASAPPGGALSSSWVPTIVRTRSASAVAVETQYSTEGTTYVGVTTSVVSSFVSNTRSITIFYTQRSESSFASGAELSRVFSTVVQTNSLSVSLTNAVVAGTSYSYIFIEYEFTSSVVSYTWVIASDSEEGNYVMSAGLTIGLGVSFGAIVILVAAFGVWLYRAKKEAEDSDSFLFSNEEDEGIFSNSSGNLINLMDIEKKELMEQKLSESVDKLMLEEKEDKLPKALDDECINILDNLETVY